MQNKDIISRTFFLKNFTRNFKKIMQTDWVDNIGAMLDILKKKYPEIIVTFNKKNTIYQLGIFNNDFDSCTESKRQEILRVLDTCITYWNCYCVADRSYCKPMIEICLSDFLTQTPKSLRRCKNLVSLEMCYNKIDSLKYINSSNNNDNENHNFKSLQKLNISNNQIKNIKCLNWVPNLETIYIGNNMLDYFEIKKIEQYSLNGVSEQESTNLINKSYKNL